MQIASAMQNRCAIFHWVTISMSDIQGVATSLNACANIVDAVGSRGPPPVYSVETVRTYVPRPHKGAIACEGLDKMSAIQI